MSWDFIINPFVTTLTFLYSILGNNVVLAIVVFTVLVRLVTYPLTIQQQRSSKAMQQLQPELKKLQEKYKNDREKLAAEQMQLYREYGVNPMGGCLPLIVQLPIMLALYQAIIFALAATPYQLMELSGRLMIPGLDALVPLQNTFLGMNLTQPPSAANIVSFALPVLVVITTWLQFKMTMPSTPPSTDADGKPNQAAAMSQSMSTIMPVMYGFFALQFSVGLSIYFIVSNIIGIVQYALMGQGKQKQTADATVGVPGKPADDSKKNESPITVEGKASRQPKSKSAAKTTRAK